jgi:hypothetical protein
MTPVIQQSVRFRTTPQALFDLYMDSTKHSRSTGARLISCRLAYRPTTKKVRKGWPKYYWRPWKKYISQT